MNTLPSSMLFMLFMFPVVSFVTVYLMAKFALPMLPWLGKDE